MLKINYFNLVKLCLIVVNDKEPKLLYSKKYQAFVTMIWLKLPSDSISLVSFFKIFLGGGMPPDPPRRTECASRTVQVLPTFDVFFHYCVRPTFVMAEQIAVWSDIVQCNIKLLFLPLHPDHDKDGNQVFLPFDILLLYHIPSSN